ncbi:MAG: hypothetical protein J0H49_00120 [Acidobacteria bacterium]|nr:hypothetical protein [Acidobacteriota bacterium]
MRESLSLKVHGIGCAEDVDVLKQELRDLSRDESDISFDILLGRMTISPDSRISAAQLVERLPRTGMKADLWSTAIPVESGPVARSSSQDSRTTSTVISGMFVAVGLCVHALLSGNLLAALAPENVNAGEIWPLAVGASTPMNFGSNGLEMR